MPTNHHIQILSGDPSTEQLTLDPATVNVEPGDQITWSIADESNVKRFRLKKKDPLFPQWAVFSRSPSDNEGVRDDIVIRRFPNPAIIEYNYSIRWREDAGGRPYEHDPKITIMPSLHLFTKKNIGIAIAVVGLVSVALLLGTRKKKCF